jgi:hypothetical protein
MLLEFAGCIKSKQTEENEDHHPTDVHELAG